MINYTLIPCRLLHAHTSWCVQGELEEPITVEEPGVSLAYAKTKKAPGPDGFTLAYYKAFFEMLSVPLVASLKSI